MISSAVDLPDAAAAYVAALPPGDWFLFDMSPLDVTGVPAWKAAFFPDDPASADTDMQQGTGYGETAGQAIIAATAECHEEIRARLGFAALPQSTGSYAELVAERGVAAVTDPLELCLPAGSPVDHDTELAWVSARRWSDDTEVLVPVDVVALTADHLPAGYRPFTTLITHGLGAGPSRGWAAAHGLMECLQRDGNGMRFRAMDAGVALRLDTELPDGIADLLARIRAAGIDVLPKIATDEFGVTNLYVVGADADPTRPPIPIAMTGAGEAADLDPAAALRKALLEFAHARARKAFTFGPLDRVAAVMPDGYWERAHAGARHAAATTEARQVAAFAHWLSLDGPALRDVLADPVLATRSERAFSSLPGAAAAVGGTEERGETVARRLVAAGLDPLIVDFTEPGAAMHAVRVVVPRLEVETMSYHRIGERNAAVLLAARSPLIRLGAPDADAPADARADARWREVRLTAAARERLGGTPYLDVAGVDARVGALYPLYREPGAHEMLVHLGADTLSAEVPV